jgi:hypothetical protein
MQCARENEVQPTYDHRQGNKAGDISNSEFGHSSLMQTDDKYARISLTTLERALVSGKVQPANQQHPNISRRS